MRLDAYIRVSRVGGREGPAFISPDVQRERCEGLATAGGHVIVAWHEDLDQVGSSADRPGFQAALERVEARETDGIVVAKLDRFARSVADAAVAMKRITAAEGSLLSAYESLDTSTAFGRFALHMMLAMAELELDRIRENWATARERAVARGVHVASRTPTGYRRREDGVLEPDPKSAPLIAKAFAARGDGASWAQIAGLLESEGVQTPYGGTHWTSRSLSHLLSNRVYLGEARSGEFVSPGAHEAIVSPRDFAAAQSAKRPRSPHGTGALLSGLLRCAGCRYVLKADSMRDRGGERIRLYRCRGPRAHGRCKSPASVLGRVIEPWVVDRFFDGLGDVEASAVKSTAELDEAEEALARAESEVEAFLEADVAEVVGVPRFREALATRQRAVETAELRLATLRAQAQPLPDAPSLRAVWDELAVGEQRHLLALGIDAVILRTASRRGLAELDSRALVLWRGEAPADLPGPGRRGDGIRPFDWPS